MPTALDYLALQRVADSSLKRAVTMSLRDGAQCFTHAWGLARAQGTVAARAESRWPELGLGPAPPPRSSVTFGESVTLQFSHG